MLVNKELCLSFFCCLLVCMLIKSLLKLRVWGCWWVKRAPWLKYFWAAVKITDAADAARNPGSSSSYWNLLTVDICPLCELLMCMTTLWRKIEGWNKCLIWSMCIYQYLLPFTHIWPIKSPSQMLQSDFAALVALLWPDFMSTADLTQSTHSSCGKREKRLKATEACILLTPCYTSAFRNICFFYLRFSSASCDVK